ncbi:peptide-methionine (S)-S-oxide reductase MsrA [Antarcticibacterium arcticum]|uniref:Peptide methionine sulfoxide reductase MsrA n=1 Tax=Antarcticibacterium arcticum TaxID=2585771 RepID=A0A5B8YHN0_9FLAO|nr:peptide-methionine (S)-S-oxide reductase MsrA [Antarcticibacterium arcticum]QED37101.1 peptide-methionine (S)-S-oxide reductase MsrA [Antarcticibacterium arcticum]
MENGKREVATLAGGCFWCTEAVFERVEGVEKVTPGFTGGSIKNPAYREIITGRTGHAEAIEIQFNPEIINFEELLYIFFSTHDPTTLNRQQYDVGTQYRSAIFYHTPEQQEMALRVIDKINKENLFKDPIVTEVTQAPPFYEAEPEHKEYYSRNPQQQYCQAIIDPKIKKLKHLFSDKLKR